MRFPLRYMVASELRRRRGPRDPHRSRAGRRCRPAHRADRCVARACRARRTECCPRCRASARTSSSRASPGRTPTTPGASPSPTPSPDRPGNGALGGPGPGGGFFGGQGSESLNRDDVNALLQSNQAVVTDLSKLGKPGTKFTHDFFLPATLLTFPQQAVHQRGPDPRCRIRRRRACRLSRRTKPAPCRRSSRRSRPAGRRSPRP